MADRPRLVILGAGFGGLFCALKLAKAPVDVILIDRNDYHTFQPLLYQVATDTLDDVTVGHPVRDLLHHHDNITFHMAEVTGVDLDTHQINLADMEPILYDYLVLGLGAIANDFGVPGVADHAFPLYTLQDAVRLREHVLLAFEAADKDPSRIDNGELTFVIVGGGPTGVETAGALLELLHTSLATDFPSLDIDTTRVVLIQGMPVLLPPFEPQLQEYAKQILTTRGVEVLTGEMVTEVAPTGVTLKSGGTIASRTVIWAGGLKPNPIVAELGVELARGGRIPVGPELTLAEHPEVFVVGDCASITDVTGQAPLPQLGAVAKQAGEHVAECITRIVAGQETLPFRYRDRGIMATIGRRAAVVQLPHGHTLTGTIAWAAWAGVHLALLSGAESRMTTLVDWGWSLFTQEHRTRIVLDEDDKG